MSRSVCFVLLAAFGCQSEVDDPIGIGGGSGGGAGSGSSAMSGSGAGAGQPGAGAPSGGGGAANGGNSNAGQSNGGQPSAGQANGGQSAAGQASGGQSNGGQSSAGQAGKGGGATAGSGGRPSGGAAGSSGMPSGGTGGGCTPNLACKLEAPAASGDNAQDCVNRINQFRTQCACLPPLQRWTEGEACANQHAQYDSTRSPHAGFTAGICMAGGSGQNECPGWRSTAQVITGCLQSMWNEGPPPQTPCRGQCFQDHGHFINMSNPSFKRVACGFFATPAGEWWAVQNFSN